MGTNIKLLVVDDEERFLRTLARRLAMRDFDVEAVTSGEEALRLAGERAFDLALVDLKMPGMNGEEVLQALKARHPDMEVVILTGHGSIDSAVHCTQAGSHAYLQKPCETEELLTVLKDAYHKRMVGRAKHNEDRMAELARAAVGESPLAILRKLKEMDRGWS